MWHSIWTVITILIPLCTNSFMYKYAPWWKGSSVVQFLHHSTGDYLVIYIKNCWNISFRTRASGLIMLLDSSSLESATVPHHAALTDPRQSYSVWASPFSLPELSSTASLRLCMVFKSTGPEVDRPIMLLAIPTCSKIAPKKKPPVILVGPV